MITHRFRAGLLLVTLFTGISHSDLRAAEAAVDTTGSQKNIPVTSTWGELRSAPIVSNSAAGKVRVGIEANQAPKNSGVMVYCLITEFDPAKFPNHFDHEGVLGPLDCHIGTGNHLVERAKVLVEKTVFAKDVSEVLFTRVVAIDQVEIFLVDLKERNKKVTIANARVRGLDQPYHAWSPFSPAQKLHHDLVASESGVYHAVLSTRPRGVALPAQDGMHPVDWEGGGRRHADSQSLPSLIPAEPDKSLTLQGDHRRLRIRSQTEMIVARPDWHYLARWWVNGKPFIPPTARSISDQNGLIITGKEIEISLEFKAADLGAKSGDTIGLQLLHLPEGWRIVHAFAEARLASSEAGTAVPRMTNRIEFQVP